MHNFERNIRRGPDNGGSSTSGGVLTYGRNPTEVEKIYTNIATIKKNVEEGIKNNPENLFGEVITLDQIKSLIDTRIDKKSLTPDQIRLLEKLFFKSILAQSINNIETAASQLYSLYLNLYSGINGKLEGKEKDKYDSNLTKIKNILNVKKQEFLSADQKVKEINNYFEPKRASWYRKLQEVGIGSSEMFNNAYKHDSIYFIYDCKETIRKYIEYLDRTGRPPLNQNFILEFENLRKEYEQYIGTYNKNIELKLRNQNSFSKYFESGDLKKDLLDDKKLVPEILKSINKDLEDLNSVTDILNSTINGTPFNGDAYSHHRTVRNLISQNAAKYPRNYEETGLYGSLLHSFSKEQRNFMFYSRPIETSYGQARIKFNFRKKSESTVDDTSVRIDLTRRGIELDIDSETMNFFENTNPAANYTYHHRLDYAPTFQQIMKNIFNKLVRPSLEDTGNKSSVQSGTTLTVPEIINQERALATIDLTEVPSPSLNSSNSATFSAILSLFGSVIKAGMTDSNTTIETLRSESIY